jgi:hypothetical protein
MNFFFNTIILMQLELQLFSSGNFTAHQQEAKYRYQYRYDLQLDMDTGTLVICIYR